MQKMSLYKFLFLEKNKSERMMTSHSWILLRKIFEFFEM